LALVRPETGNHSEFLPDVICTQRQLPNIDTSNTPFCEMNLKISPDRKPNPNPNPKSMRNLP